MTQRNSPTGLWMKLAILPGLAITLYLLLVQISWHKIGFNPAFGLVTWFFMYGVFPYWFAWLSNSVRSTKLKQMVAFCVYAALVFLIAYLGQWLSIHASGYLEDYIKNPHLPGAAETLGIEPLVRTFVCTLALILFSVYYFFRKHLN